MQRSSHGIFIAALLVGWLMVDQSVLAQRKPAPPPSRYRYTLEFEAKSLPKGVTVRERKAGEAMVYSVKNTGDAPLIINRRFQNDTLVSGAKLVSGKVYHYFPNGVPMEGKTHLKGWQAPFGDIEETNILLPKEPAKIDEGRKPGLSKDLPPPEPVTIPVEYDGKPFELKAVIHFHLNEAYDQAGGSRPEA